MADVKLSVLKPDSVIGVLGGGQLGRMICFAAHQLGYHTVVFSDVKNSPASFVTNQTIVADFTDKEALLEFVNKIDIATLEFENIPVFAARLISKYKPLYPEPKILEITQNRLKEKNFLRAKNIAVTDYYRIENLQELESIINNSSEKFILKTTLMGYDGKGQAIVTKNDDLEKIWEKINNRSDSNQEMILEKFVDFNSEISVITARDVNGSISSYDPLTNVHRVGILNKSIYPAKISARTQNQAKEIAEKIAKEFNLIGLIAVEFFVMKDGSLLVNEMAPRPHNSGHFSIDASNTSQFEQLIRAISGIGLGNNKFHSKGYMENIIGNDFLKISKYYGQSNAKIHLYGKSEIKEGRKMGHINFLEI